jgi:predicted acyltransferase
MCYFLLGYKASQNEYFMRTIIKQEYPLMPTRAPSLINRLLSLDVFRGMTIAGMILVNSPGNNTSYAWLEHSTWDGCTPADLVFPFFLFILGVSLVFSLSSCLERGMSNGKIVIKILKRTAIIFALGLVLNGFPHYDFSTIRIPGVLQRIAICYCFAALIFLTTRFSIQILITASLLIGYWMIMTLIPIPGFGADDLSKAGNVAAYLDRIFLLGHTYRPEYDPEGILSTLPAIATTLLGCITGTGLLSKYTARKKLLGMYVIGILALITGWLWGMWFPINKALWTSSFVLWTGGLALCLLALCYWLIEIRQWRSWSKPFEIFGTNALAAYFLHILFLKIQNLVHIQNALGKTHNLRLVITDHLFGWASAQNASLLYAVGYMLFWLLIMTVLYRRKIFIRI